MLKARFVIAEETLLAWASLIEGEPSEAAGAPLDEVRELFMRDVCFYSLQELCR